MKPFNLATICVIMIFRPDGPPVAYDAPEYPNGFPNYGKAWEYITAARKRGVDLPDGANPVEIYV